MGEPAIQVSRRVRPLRIGYRIDPLDAGDQARAIDTAASQWGGIFHPLIPALLRRPRWWQAGPRLGMGAAAIERSFLEAFDCDFVVDARPGASEERGVDKISFGQLRHDSGEEGIEAGMPASAVYRQLWSEEFRWEARARSPVIIPIAADPTLSPLIAACFGRLSGSPDLGGQREEFERLLGGSPLSIGPHNYLDGFPVAAHETFLTPLGLAAHGLTSQQPGHDHWAEILLLDHRESVDIFDFWNLRASGRMVIPVPLCWQEQLLPVLGERLASQRKGRWNEEVLLLGGRRVADEAIAEASRQLKDAGVAIVRSALPWPGADLSAAWVSAGEDDVELRQNPIDTTLPLASPRVAEQYTAGVYRWANIVNYKPWTLPRDGSVAAYFPPQLGEVSELFRQGSHLTVRAGLEGVLIPTGSLRDGFDFTPPSGERVLSQLLTGSPVAAKPTEPGRAATQLIRQMKGLPAVGLIQRQRLVKLFNKAAHGGVLIDGSETRPPRPASRALPFKTIDAAVAKIHPQSRRGRENLMRGLVERDVLRVGVQLDCPQCAYVNWIQLDAIAQRVRCERCLEGFDFPQDNPPSQSAWAYRPAGAFSIPDYATGGYAVAFALRFLTEDRLGSRSSWCTGFQLDHLNEIDFAVVLADDDEVRPKISLVLGEAKSFGTFEERDFKRAATLRKRYPDAILAFATLREQFSGPEKALLTALARPQASHPKELAHSPEVLVLTATELFSREGPPDCWADSGGVAAGLARARHGLRAAIATWADATLQLHVGLDPHRDWYERERERLLGDRS